MRFSLVVTLVVSVVLVAGVSFAARAWLVRPHALADLAVDSTSEEPDEPIRPIEAPRVDRRKVALGGRLFDDARLSKDGTVSCASCHDLEHGGTDGRVRSVGVHGALGEVNAPTVFNVALNVRQFWDGRAASLEEQLDGPIESTREMASSWPAVLDTLRADDDYVADFDELYEDGVTEANVKDAFAEFERSLMTVNSRFDRFLRGNPRALTSDERQGYELFKSHGCASCHRGANVGGEGFEQLGVMGDYFGDRGHVKPSDFGRYNVTRREEDRYKFRVPSLRLAVQTAPYFHDGSAATLDEAVDVMARYQLGYRLPERDRRLIIAFLATLAGEQPYAEQRAER